MPAGAVQQQDGLRSGRDLGADLGQVGFIAAMLATGVITAAPTPRAGQIAPNK